LKHRVCGLQGFLLLPKADSFSRRAYIGTRIQERLNIDSHITDTTKGIVHIVREDVSVTSKRLRVSLRERKIGCKKGKSMCKKQQLDKSHSTSFTYDDSCSHQSSGQRRNTYRFRESKLGSGIKYFRQIGENNFFQMAQRSRKSYMLNTTVLLLSVGESQG
jgi:hypothetical protein